MDNFEPLNTDSGSAEKMDVDYSAMCDEKIAAAESLAARGKLQEALIMLRMLEKQTRKGSDMTSTSRLWVAIVKLCFQAKEWELLNQHILKLNYKKSELKLAVTAMVRKCCTFVNDAPDNEIKLKIIESLRVVTEGKTYLGNEIAFLTGKLAQIQEEKLLEPPEELEQTLIRFRSHMLKTLASIPPYE